MKVLLLGATGSIGRQTLKVIEKQKHQLIGVSFFNNHLEGNKIIKKFKPKYYWSNKIKNVSSITELIKKSNADIVVNAISGFAGIEPTINAIKNKNDIALANKESLVAAGDLIQKLLKTNKVNIYPIDSEHSAIYLAQKNKKINKIYLTASGGAVYNKDLKNVKYEQLVKHPKWNMGEKITFESSLLINKAFEIIEAYWLFNTSKIVPLYHPQAIVHSMVECIDSTIYAIMSNPSMILPIQLALNKYQHLNNNLVKPLDFKNLTISFNYIDQNKYLPIKWAFSAIKKNKTTYGALMVVLSELIWKQVKNKKIMIKDVYHIFNKYLSNKKYIYSYNSYSDLTLLKKNIEKYFN